MKLEHVQIENVRAIRTMKLPLHKELTVLYGENGHGKTSVLRAIAVALGSIPQLLPDVPTIDFKSSDRRATQPIRVELTTTQGITWQRRRYHPRSRVPTTRQLRELVSKIITADREGQEPLDLPIVAYYDTDRAVFDVPQRRSRSRQAFSRYDALDGALQAQANFRQFFNWFYERENQELRLVRDQGHNGALRELDAVRRAIQSMIPGASNPRIDSNPTRFVVTMRFGSENAETLSIDQLGGGYRIMLALVADLARRMAQGNPHLDDPLQSEAIILIDEVELHLHPAWQQRVLTDLVQTFPNTQFIVSTHSPHVLTTIRPENIIQLQRSTSGVAASRPFGPTYGAEAGEILQNVMGVNQRPTGNAFVQLLEQYQEHISNGNGESDIAKEMRTRLEELSAGDPEMDRADLEIRRQNIFSRMGQST